MKNNDNLSKLIQIKDSRIKKIDNIKHRNIIKINPFKKKDIINSNINFVNNNKNKSFLIKSLTKKIIKKQKQNISLENSTIDLKNNITKNLKNNIIKKRKFLNNRNNRNINLLDKKSYTVNNSKNKNYFNQIIKKNVFVNKRENNLNRNLNKFKSLQQTIGTIYDIKKIIYMNNIKQKQKSVTPNKLNLNNSNNNMFYGNKKKILSETKSIKKIPPKYINKKSVNNSNDNKNKNKNINKDKRKLVIYLKKSNSNKKGFYSLTNKNKNKNSFSILYKNLDKNKELLEERLNKKCNFKSILYYNKLNSNNITKDDNSNSKFINYELAKSINTNTEIKDSLLSLSFNILKKRDYFINNNNKILDYENSGVKKFDVINKISKEKNLLKIQRKKEDLYFEMSSNYDIEEFKEEKDIKRIIPVSKIHLKFK